MVVMETGNTHEYQVSLPCIAWFASLKSEEVVTGKSALVYFLFMVVMKTLKYICVEVILKKTALGCLLLVVAMETN